MLFMNVNTVGIPKKVMDMMTIIFIGMLYQQ